jgi:site-specific recombinase XerC
LNSYDIRPDGKTLTTSALINACADAINTTPEKSAEALRSVGNVIGREIKRGQHVTIPGFGTFGGGRPIFRPADDLIMLLNSAEAGPIETTPDKRCSSERTPDRPTKIRRPAPPPIRSEDAELIENWLAARHSSAETEVAIFEPSPKRGCYTRFLSERSISTARHALRHFARRCAVPLVEVGLSGDSTMGPEDPLGVYRTGTPQREILRYAEKVIEGMVERLGPEGLQRYRYAASWDAKSRKTPVPFMTRTWANFLRYAGDFFCWCEQQGLRPKGSNPLIGVQRPTAVTLSRGKILIRTRWYEALLNSPALSPRERAAIFLLGNGLTVSEVARTRIDCVFFRNQALKVHGKGAKVRMVPLYPWTIKAILYWLEARTNNASPWCFPSRSEAKHIGRHHVWRIFRGVVARVFHRPEDQEARERVHPNGLRDYFIKTALALKVHPAAVMAAVGSSSPVSVMRHQMMDDVRIEREFRKISKRPF